VIEGVPDVPDVPDVPHPGCGVNAVNGLGQYRIIGGSLTPKGKLFVIN